MDEVFEILLLDDRESFGGWKVRCIWEKYGLKILWGVNLFLDQGYEFLCEHRGKCGELGDGFWYRHLGFVVLLKDRNEYKVVNASLKWKLYIDKFYKLRGI